MKSSNSIALGTSSSISFISFFLILFIFFRMGLLSCFNSSGFTSWYYSIICLATWWAMRLTPLCWRVSCFFWYFTLYIGWALDVWPPKEVKLLNLLGHPGTVHGYGNSDSSAITLLFCFFVFFSGIGYGVFIFNARSSITSEIFLVGSIYKLCTFLM